MNQEVPTASPEDRHNDTGHHAHNPTKWNTRGAVNHVYLCSQALSGINRGTAGRVSTSYIQPRIQKCKRMLQFPTFNRSALKTFSF